MDGRAASARGPGPSEADETMSGKGSAFKAEEDDVGWEAGRGETRWGRGAQPGQIQGKELFMLLVWKAIGLSPGQRLPGGSERTRWARLTQLALVQVLVAGGARVAGLAQAERGARQGVGAALGFPVARLAQAPVLQVAQEACRAGGGGGGGEGERRLSAAPGASLAAPPPAPAPPPRTCAARGAEAGEGAHAVDAGGSGGTGGSGAIVQVLLAAGAAPAADTHAVEAASRVPAGAAVSAARGALGRTLVHVFRAIRACRRGRPGWSGPGEAGLTICARWHRELGFRNSPVQASGQRQV